MTTDSETADGDLDGIAGDCAEICGGSEHSKHVPWLKIEILAALGKAVAGKGGYIRRIKADLDIANSERDRHIQLTIELEAERDSLRVERDEAIGDAGLLRAALVTLVSAHERELHKEARIVFPRRDDVGGNWVRNSTALHCARHALGPTPDQDDTETTGNAG